MISSYPSHLRSTQSLTHLIHAANASLTVNSHLSLSLSDGCGYLSMWILSSSLLPPCWHQINAGSAAASGSDATAARDRRSARCLPSDGRTMEVPPPAGAVPSSATEGERAFVRPPVRPTDALARGIFREAREIRDVVLDGKAPSSPAFHISCTIKLLKCVSINYVD